MRLLRIKITTSLTLVEGASYLARQGQDFFVGKGMQIWQGNAGGMRPGWYLFTKDRFYHPSELVELYRIARTRHENR